MPFTLTHTLAIVPLAQRCNSLPAAALCIGAMMPDWSLFVPFGPHYTTMHTLTGIFTACIPLGLLMFVLFRCLYRRALIELLPAAAQSRLGVFRRWQLTFSRRELLLAAVAVGIGAASHLLWDAFTHEGRWGEQAVSFLSTTVFSIGASDVQGYKLLQHGSSAIGLPLLLLFACRWLGRQNTSAGFKPLLSARKRGLLLMLLFVAPLLAVAAKVAFAVQAPLTPESISDALFIFVTQLGLLCFQLFNIYCIGLMLLTSFDRGRESDVDIESSPG